VSGFLLFHDGEECLGDGEGAACVDVVDEIVAFHGGVVHVFPPECSGVVDDGVHASEVIECCVGSGLDALEIGDIASDGKNIGAVSGKFFGSGEDGAGELWVFFGGFCGDDDVPAFAGEFVCDCFAYSA